jgi:RNA polymerase sigma factor (TIGR02999 family)
LEPGIGELLAAAESADAESRQALFAALYDELMQTARRALSRGGPRMTVGAATLVHELYVDLSTRSGPSFPDKARFLAYAARAMRGIIIDHARRRCALKRGGNFQITAMPSEIGAPAVDDRELARVGEALDELAQVDGALAQVVDLRFFCGLSFAEIAGLQGVSTRTVQRQWDKARIYLHSRLQVDVDH